MEKVKTRNLATCHIFGFPQDFKQTSLLHYSYKRNELKKLANGKDPTVNDVSEIAAAMVKEIWLKSSLPTVVHK